MKAYAAIGHFKDSKNLTSVALTASTKKSFLQDCYGNDFVPYVIITESMLAKIITLDCIDLFDQVKKLTTNYRIWNDICDYIEQCSDIIVNKMEIAKNE